MTTRGNSFQPTAGSTSSVSREAALGLPTVVADMLLDDICHDDTPFSAVNTLQLRPSPTGARNERRRTDMMISQDIHTDEGIRSTRICGLRDGRYGAVHSRYHYSSSSPTSSTGDDEAKRRKNREAAARCRQRKSERVVRLEEKAKQLMEDNDGLEREAAVLQNQITEIRSSLLKHVQSGCPIGYDWRTGAKSMSSACLGDLCY